MFSNQLLQSRPMSHLISREGIEKKQQSKIWNSSKFWSSWLQSTGSKLRQQSKIWNSSKFWSIWLQSTGSKLRSLISTKNHAIAEELEAELNTYSGTKAPSQLNWSVYQSESQNSLEENKQTPSISVWNQLIQRCQILLNEQPDSAPIRWILIKALHARERYHSAHRNLLVLKESNPSFSRDHQELEGMEWSLWILRSWWIPSLAFPMLIALHVAAEQFHKTYQKFYFQNLYQTLKEEKTWH